MPLQTTQLYLAPAGSAMGSYGQLWAAMGSYNQLRSKTVAKLGRLDFSEPNTFPPQLQKTTGSPQEQSEAVAVSKGQAGTKADWPSICNVSKHRISACRAHLSKKSRG